MSGSPTSDATSPPRPRLRRNRKRKTCIPCAKSKRKCDQSVPWCRRCIEKETACVYPPRRGGLMSVPVDNDSSSIPDESVSRPLIGNGCAEGVASGPTDVLFSTCKGKDARMPQRRENPDLNYSPGLSPYQWFLSPGSWHHSCSLDAHIMSLPPELEVSVSQDSLPHFINKHQQWIRLWTKEGHSPLMHRHLYQDLMPVSIRDAYTARAAYDLAGTSAAKALSLRIIQDRATDLIQCQPDFRLDLAGEENASLHPGSLDDSSMMLGTFAHLARTQALFVYEMTQLFDGDIRARDQAESHMETLHRWACQMLESAKLDCTTGEVFESCVSSTSSGSSPSSNGDLIRGTNSRIGTSSNTAAGAITPPSSTHNPFALPPNPAPHTLWQVWVIAESVRRTYISACFVRAVYQTMKTQWSVCPGGALFSGLSGLWDAETGREWCAALKNGDARNRKAAEDTMSPWALMQSLEVWKVLEHASPDEVDEFAVAVAEISRGMEVVEQWVMERGSS